jgi:Uncharacterized protein conserved in bacteria (DUF2059)
MKTTDLNERKKLIAEYLTVSGKEERIASSITMLLLQAEKLVSNKDYLKLKKKYTAKNVVGHYFGMFDVFTNEDLKELIAFSKSPLGVKLKENTDNLMSKTMLITQGLMAEMGKDISGMNAVNIKS